MESAAYLKVPKIRLKDAPADNTNYDRLDNEDTMFDLPICKSQLQCKSQKQLHALIHDFQYNVLRLIHDLMK